MTSTLYPSLKADANSLKLNTGASVPCLGLGTWRAPDEQVTKAVEVALKNGYRHIDTATAYGACLREILRGCHAVDPGPLDSDSKI